MAKKELTPSQFMTAAMPLTLALKTAADAMQTANTNMAAATNVEIQFEAAAAAVERLRSLINETTVTETGKGGILS